MVCCHTTDFKPVKQEVNGAVILPPLVFPGKSISLVKLIELFFWQNIMETLHDTSMKRFILFQPSQNKFGLRKQ